ncbi:hypothetical protein CEE45_03975 [Candidatus Heimdallarchaeota archaeon B3_Heim]|nr:MAG: hypothetical protein CEE45_03975 [Candidatus Heimdallarchaeota archaeon B3_Heim]
MKAGKPILIAFSLIFLVLSLGPIINRPNSIQIKSTIFTPTEMPTNYTMTGYYTNSNSTYSNAAFHLLKHGAIGNSLTPFSTFSNLSQFSLIIVPYKLTWTPMEISLLETFVSQGGLAFLTASIPSSLFDLSVSSNDDFWIIPTDILAQSISDKTHLKRQISYYRAAQDVSLNLYPFDIVRELKYISNIDEPNYEILHTASLDSGGTEPLGYATVAKKMGLGRLVFSTIPFFDLWGMSATGGPTVPSSARLGLLTGLLSTMVNQFVTQLFLMHGTMVPLRWHTPYGKLGLINSRDDIDAYKKSTVLARGTVDRAHGIPSIFYELRDDVPSGDWPEVLDISSEFPEGYHIPGYHRHTAFEITAQQYLDVILDIEQESGTRVYFECHHGAGSGFFGQNYVRSAIEATDSLDHFVLYTSSEGGNGNEYVEPYLYLLPNGTIIRAKNYYSLPKVATIDRQVSSNDVPRFKEIVTQAVFQHEYLRHVHYLLHSQNVWSSLSTYYDNLLTYGVDPIYEYLYSDPISFVELNRAYVENVTTKFKSNTSQLIVEIQANQDINGYTFLIPYNRSIFLSDILINNVPVDLNTIKILHNGNSGFLLFSTDLVEGTQEVIIKFQGEINPLPIDQDFDGIQDEFEVKFLGTSSSKYDTDNDGISDGDELFVLDTNPLNGNDITFTSTSVGTSTTSTSSDTTSISSNPSSDPSSETTPSFTSTPDDTTTIDSTSFALGSILIGLIALVVVQYRKKKY